MFIQKKNFFNKYFFISSVIFFIPFFLNFYNYSGNKFLFFIFHLCSLGLFLITIQKKTSAFEFFFYIFLLLSFWFKFSCILYFDDIKLIEGDFNLSVANYDRPMFIITITFIACILASLVNKKLFLSTSLSCQFQIKDSFLLFYKKYRILIIYLVVIFLIFIWFSNFNYKIYSKGLVNNSIYSVIKYFYSWSLTYGLAVLVSQLIYIDFHVFNKKKIFILGFIEAFFTNVVIYSRAFLLISSAYLRGFFLLIQSTKNFRIPKFYIFKFVFVICIFFFISFYSVKQLRSSFFHKPNSHSNAVSMTETINEVKYLLINRWVGIDALLSVSQSNKLNFAFFLSAWKEQKEVRNNSFYINHFFNSFKYSDQEEANVNIVITPGLIAFLLYSGSAFLIFFSVFFIILISVSIEKFFYLLSFGNIILSNIIGYSLALRLIHFGYVPSNTINFSISFLVTLFGVYIMSKIIWKKV
jgi:hypothetical protein